MFIFTRRRILIRENQMVEAFKILNRYGLTTSIISNMEFGNCGWKAAADCWFIHVTVCDRVWYNVLHSFKDCNIELLPETIRYN